MPGISGFNRYEINGLISTDKPVFENLERICNNAGAWLSYDAYTGLWSVIINQPGTSVRSFDDSNIIGSLRVNGTSLTDLYNSVEVQFPQRELNDQPDFIRIEIPAGDRNANEPDNTLNITLDLINEQTQAEVLGLMELKQSRVDKVITFTSDYTALSLTAGDLIDVTNTQYGFANKMFRVINLQEEEDDSGQITCNISALEYDADVYNYDTVDRYTRTTADGIVTKGAIGTPNTPQITKFEKDARPHILVEAIVPTGIVEGMEFWVSADNSTFVLAGTEYPTGGGVWTSGQTSRFDYDWAAGGNVYTKVRGMNSTTVGPYSTTASAVYTPVQTTDALDPNTDVVDANGNSLLTTLALTALLASLNGLLAGNSTAAGSMFDKIFDLFDQDTGRDIRDGTISTFTDARTIGNTQSQLNTMAGNLAVVYDGSTSYPAYNAYQIENFPIISSANLTTGGSLLTIEITTPLVEAFYWSRDAGAAAVENSIYAQPAMELEVFRGNNLGSATSLATSTIDWNTNRNIFNFDDPTPGIYWVVGKLIPTYDLSMNWPRSESIGGANVYFQQIIFTDFTVESPYSASFKLFF